ncbi:MAG: hypothetical protein ACFUZC_11605 [Chthoniobacteraceae bacterium]
MMTNQNTLAVAPLEIFELSGRAAPGSGPVKIEVENAGYSNLFIPINNGFVRPFKKLVGGKYPRATPEDGGVTYGFGFHCHDNAYGCFTPVVSQEVSGAVFALEFYAPEPICRMAVHLRPGGNDDDACGACGSEWETHELNGLEGGRIHRLRLSVKTFDPDFGFRLDLSPEDVIYVRSARIIPCYTAKPDASGAWRLSLSAPVPYGFREKEFHYRIVEGENERREKILVRRNEAPPAKNPTEAACQWVLHRYAAPRLGSRRGAFPLAYYDSFAKTFYASGHTMWIRPYMVMPLVEMALRGRAPANLLHGLADYVCQTDFLETFFPEKRSGYLEYCGTGNFYYGAVAMLWHVTKDERLKERLLRFVAKYMDSQKVHTPMRSFPEQCHNYRGEHLLPTITANGHEETMQAAVTEAFRVTHSAELLHEAIGERGMGFLEHPVYGAVRVPERLRESPASRDLYGYYVSLHMQWARSRDAIHYRAEGLIRLYEVTGDQHWIRLASRRVSNYLRYIGEKVGNEFLDINFEYPQTLTSQFQSDASLNTATGGSDGEYFQDIYTAAGLLQHYLMDAYLREKLRQSIMLIGSVIRTNTEDPESAGEAWIPHYAWKGDYENRSAGSRIMSPWIAAGALLRAESAGFRFDDRSAYRGPLYGCRKLVDAASAPEGAHPGEIEGWFDLPDGTHELSLLKITNAGGAAVTIERVEVNGSALSGPLILSTQGTTEVDILAVALGGKQNHLRIVLGAESPATLLVHHRLASKESTLFAAGMNEFFGGNFVRRNIVLHNPYAPIAEKSFHVPSQPESYFRALPPDEGYETAQESSFVRSWKPLIELGSDVRVERVVKDENHAELHFLGAVDSEGLVIYDQLWTDADGKILNGDKLTNGQAVFRDPTSRSIARARKTGEHDILHPECTLPVAVFLDEGMLRARVMNYVGAADFQVEILTDDPLWLELPVRSENTAISFNGETVFAHHRLKNPNGFEIDASAEDERFIRFRLRRPGTLRVRISSDAEIPGQPAGAAAAWIDSTGLSSEAVRLWWQASLEANRGHYNIYRASCAEGPFEFVGWSPEPGFTDFSTHKNQAYFYTISAVSAEGKEGMPGPAINC